MADIDVRVAPIGELADGGHVIALQGSPATPTRIAASELGGNAAQFVPAATTNGHVLTLVSGVRAWAAPTGGGGVSAYGDLTDIPDALGAIDGLAPAADRIAYYTGAATAALTPLTAFGISLLDDANAAAGLATLGISGVLTAADLAEPAGSIAQKVDGTTGAIAFAEGVNSVPTVAELIAGATDGLWDASGSKAVFQPRLNPPAAGGNLAIDASLGLTVDVYEGADNITVLDDCWDNLPLHQTMEVTFIADSDARTITFADPLVNLLILSGAPAPYNEVNCRKLFYFKWTALSSDVSIKDKRVAIFAGYLVVP